MRMEMSPQVGTVTAVLDSDLDTVCRVGADGPGQAEKLERVVEGDPLEGHGCEQ